VVKDTFSGFLHSPLVAFAPASSVGMTEVEGIFTIEGIFTALIRFAHPQLKLRAGPCPDTNHCAAYDTYLNKTSDIRDAQALRR
jgi:hypothetical protein